MNAVIVTGSNGGIGTAICNMLKNSGYYVVGIDRKADINGLDGFIELDIRDIVVNASGRDIFISNLENELNGYQLKALINNAAVQILSSFEELKVEDFIETIDTNLNAPLILGKLLFPKLKASKGSIVNIGSIHSKLTKPGFVSYATSKTALLGLTQALAVDSGHVIRVNAIQPAATATEMLLDGFKENPDAFEILKGFHPTRTIATPSEIAEAVKFVISDSCQFLNGSVIDINGGIGSRLHDPV
ncbi:SDR family oxidoreductase [Photobacterium sp. WH24]|uniref:SDR family NAD(P)-dependent oxidoreductase n=1 Tax=Photobacterium sp. WH24 TaxID=2827237 RepID=UPI001C4858F5|nr:SDR family oxidoreductase [Photobacterium sp. WH24]MBV7260588.1 SDR family oxidoreductase [Photobacterium sp. WH24]